MAKKANTKKGGKGSGDGAGVSPVALWSGRGRAVGAIIGFAVAFWVSYTAGMGTVDAALRGLVGAVAFSLVGWLCALMVMRGLIHTAVHTPPPEAAEGHAAEPAGGHGA